MTAELARVDLAVRRGVLYRNAATLAETPPVAAHEPTFFTPPQAIALLKAIEGERLRPLFTVTMTTLLRPSDALGLRWEDVEGRRHPH